MEYVRALAPAIVGVAAFGGGMLFGAVRAHRQCGWIHQPSYQWDYEEAQRMAEVKPLLENTKVVVLRTDGTSART